MGLRVVQKRVAQKIIQHMYAFLCKGGCAKNNTAYVHMLYYFFAQGGQNREKNRIVRQHGFESCLTYQATFLGVFGVVFRIGFKSGSGK